MLLRPHVVVGGANADVGFLDPPANFTATAASSNQIDLDWDAVSGASTYMVMRDGIIIKTGIATTSYSDTGLDELTTYNYRVKGVA